MCDPPAVGTQVEVQGLKSRPDLNGKRGWVTAYDIAADRVEVSFDGPSRDKIKVKPPNAVPVAKAQSSADGLVVGACVQIVGLQSRADLNNRRASIVSRDDVAGRIEVQLDGLSGNERIKVKPANVIIAKDGLAVGVQVEIVDFQPHLNGRRGQLVGREVGVDFLTGGDRLEVHLDGPNGGERIKCKPENAKLVSRTLDLGAAVEIAAAAARAKAKLRDAGLGEDADRKGRDPEPERPAKGSQWDRSNNNVDMNAFIAEQNKRGDREQDRDRKRGREPERSERDRGRERSRSRPRSGLGPGAAPPRPGPGSGGIAAQFRADRAPPPGSTPFNFTLNNGNIEDRGRDWVCTCGERNFAKRAECHKCRAPRHANAPSFADVSQMIQQERVAAAQAPRIPRPMGGPLGTWTSAKDLLGQSDFDALRARVDARKRRSPSSSSSSSSRRKVKKSKKKRSRSSSSESEQNFDQVASAVASSNTELDKLKNEALKKLTKIKDEAPEARKKAWRALLLEWHPDKQSPEDKENATAVFQFLQKAKPLLDLKGAG